MRPLPGAYTRTETLAVTTKTAPVGAIGRDDEVATVQACLDGLSSRPAALLFDGDIGVPEDAS
jgi:hypothetical protein